MILFFFPFRKGSDFCLTKQTHPCFLTPPRRRFDALDLGEEGRETAEGVRGEGTESACVAGVTLAVRLSHALQPARLQNAQEFLPPFYSIAVSWILHFTLSSLLCHPNASFFYMEFSYWQSFYFFFPENFRSCLFRITDN